MVAWLMLAAAAASVAGYTVSNYEYSCIHYCKSDNDANERPYCCRIAKEFLGDLESTVHHPIGEEISSTSECPPARSPCPLPGHLAQQQVCSTDADCASTDKCCDDACSDTRVCRSPVDRPRISAPGKDEPGTAQASRVLLIESGSPVNVPVDAEGNRVTVVEGDAVTIVATGSARFPKSQNIYLLDDSVGNVATKKIKRSVLDSSDTVSTNAVLSSVDSVSIVKDRYGNVVLNEDKPLMLVQTRRGPTIILNDSGLKVLAGHDTGRSGVLGVVTPTTVPDLEVHSHQSPSSDPEESIIKVTVKADGSSITLVDAEGPLHIQNSEGVPFVAAVPVAPQVTATETPVVQLLPVTSEDDSGIFESDAVKISSEEENAPHVGRRWRRSSSLANAIVDGNDVIVTLVNASDVEVAIVDVSGNKVDVVAGDHILNIGESSVAVIEFTEGRHVVQSEKGRILLDKMGSPLTVMPASYAKSLPDIYSIVDGEDKPVNLVASDGLPASVYDSQGNRLELDGGLSDLEVTQEIISITKRSSGEDILVQNGEALADEDGNLLKAKPVDRRPFTDVSLNALVDGNGNTVNLLNVNGSPATVVDDDNNVVPVEAGNKNMIIEDFKVTVQLQDSMMVVKKPSGEPVFDENGLPVTLAPESRSFRRRRSLVSDGFGVVDSHQNTVTLTDEHGVPVTLSDGKGHNIKPIAGEILMETEFTTVFIVETEEGKRIADGNGNLIVDSEGNALSFVSTSEIVSLQTINVIVDGTNNTVQLVSINGSPITIVDEQGKDVAVGDGDVRLVKNTNKAMIMDMEDNTEVLVDTSGNILTDLQGANLRVLTEKKSAQKVVVNVLVNGEGNTVTLTTLEGAPVTLFDNEEEVVTVAGDVELAVDGTNTARVRRSPSGVNVIDEKGNPLADDSGKLLTMKSVDEHEKTTVATNVLVDGEGNSVSMVDLNGSPVTVVDDSGNSVALASGEKTLKVQMTGVLQVMEIAAEETSSKERASADGVKTKQRLLVDDSGNPVFSEKGPIQVVPTDRLDLAPEGESFLEVTEEFVEVSLSLRRLAAVVKDEQHFIQLNLVRESSTKRSRNYESFVEEINVFVDVVGKLQAKCLRKLKQILEKEHGSHEEEAFVLLEEMNEMLPNNIP
ncbi:uncharacterized protein LOC122260363 isoform X2 [Penaeus japonicus]|uniref:uncharacterized protein LOC122260363 isoform X2 n=1 Tax=Penaeus japonicus TaxID=27405 RepID=UPI001C71610E|nr:uncharacterized protein LOC122260363 isoform X2 [Penaeus japonicus]